LWDRHLASSKLLPTSRSSLQFITDGSRLDFRVEAGPETLRFRGANSTNFNNTYTASALYSASRIYLNLVIVELASGLNFETRYRQKLKLNFSFVLTKFNCMPFKVLRQNVVGQIADSQTVNITYSALPLTPNPCGGLSGWGQKIGIVSFLAFRRCHEHRLSKIES
jgi:hypothetical protein